MALNELSVLGDPDWIKIFRLMESPDISECAVNGKDSVWIKHKGIRKHVSDISWPSDEAYTDSVKSALGLSGFVSSHIPYDDKAALFEGPIVYKGSQGKVIRGRAHIVLPPVSGVPLLTFAKKSRSLISLESIADKGSMTDEMLRFIKAAIYSDLSIAISGGTGAGKTTMLEAMTKLFPEDIRIAVCEDTPELELTQNNVAYMQSLPWRPGMDQNNVATLSWVVQQVNRQRTDRVIVGETRGKEFADFLTVANSGMDGSMTTIHASTPKECLSKMAGFALRGSGDNVPIRAINKDIAYALDLIIQLSYSKKTGKHYVHSISEISKTVSDSTDAMVGISAIYSYVEADGLHIRENPPSDALRKKLRDAGIDVSEFTGAKAGWGTEPQWLDRFGPTDDSVSEERTLRRPGSPHGSSRKSGFGISREARRNV